MRNLVDEVIALLEAQTYPVTIKTLCEGYPRKNPMYPAIIVHEFDNSSRTVLNGEEHLANISYEIEIYAKDMLVDGTPTSSKTVVKDIAGVIDDAVNEQFGFTRMVATLVPYNKDETVARYILRYTAILDTRTDYLYR